VAPAKAAGAASHVGFSAGGQRFSVPASHVLEVVEKPALARVPLAPPCLLGVGNLRGRVLPVLSLSGASEGAIAFQQAGGQQAGAQKPGATHVLVMEQPVFLGILVDGLPWLATGQEFAAPALPDSLAHAPAGALPLASSPALPAGSREVAAPRAQVAAAETSFVCFDVGRQTYALPIGNVREVATLPENLLAADLPPASGADAAMMGVVAWRGGVLPIILLRALLGQPPAPDHALRHMVVIALGAHVFGLAVERMRPVLRVPPGAIDPVPPVLSRGRGEARLQGICRTAAGKLVAVLSPEGVFDAETVTRLLAVARLESPPEPAADPHMKTRFLAVRLGDQLFGLPAACVREVMRRPPAQARLPHAPDFVLGLMNWHGHALPLIDPRRRFGDTAPAGRLIVVVSVEARTVALCVDGVPGFLAGFTQQPQAAPKLPAPGCSPGERPVMPPEERPVVCPEERPVIDRIACMGQEGRIVMLLDAGALLNDLARAIAS
jgi:purine-binding chemotaxis protein CheW